MTKLTNVEIDILQELIQKRLKEIDNGPEGTDVYFKPEILEKINKKLNTMYFQ